MLIANQYHNGTFSCYSFSPSLMVMKLFSFLGVSLYTAMLITISRKKDGTSVSLTGYIISFLSLVQTSTGTIFQNCLLRALRTNILVYYKNLNAQYHKYLTGQTLLQHVATRICHLQRVNLPSFKPATIDTVILQIT